VEVEVHRNGERRRGLIRSDDFDEGPYLIAFDTAFECPVWYEEEEEWYEEEEVRLISSSVQSAIRTWASATRGRDVFLRGMPSFDIPTAVDAMIDAKLKKVCPVKLDNLAEGGDDGNEHFNNSGDEYEVTALDQLERIIQQLSHPQHWTVSMNEVRAYGHFSTLRDHSEALRRVTNVLASGDSPPRQHLVRYAPRGGVTHPTLTLSMSLRRQLAGIVIGMNLVCKEIGGRKGGQTMAR
jgi:hypothetical protein